MHRMRGERRTFESCPASDLVKPVAQWLERYNVSLFACSSTIDIVPVVMGMGYFTVNENTLSACSLATHFAGGDGQSFIISFTC
jgi:hypothetical protein